MCEPFGERFLRRALFIAVAVFFFSGQLALAQGTIYFKTTITGFEVIGGEKFPVRGSGNLTLTGNRLSYDIYIPLRQVRPVEAHFHGPAVGGEIPIFSLVAFQAFGNSIRYTGSNDFEGKWLPDIRTGQWYINLHNPSYDNAVLTGFIVPEPGPAGLLALGFAAFAARASRENNREAFCFPRR